MSDYHSDLEEMMHSLSNGKRTLQFASAIDSRLVCQLCGNLMREPIQTNRGMMSCKSCYVSHIPQKPDLLSEIICPLDGQVYSLQEEKLFYRADKYIAREISKIRVKCEYPKCTWVGCLDDINDHEAGSCDFAYTYCDECDAEVLRKDLKNHQIDSCQGKEKHNDYDQADQYSAVNVEACVKKLISGKDVESIGITTTNSSDNIDDLLEPIQRLSMENKNLSEENKKCNEKIDKAIKENELQRNEIENLKYEVQQMKTFIKQKNEIIAKRNKELSEIIKIQEQWYDQTFFKDKMKKLNEIESTKGNDSFFKGSEELGKLFKHDEQIQQLENAQALLSANLADAELKVQLLEHQSTTGRQVWRIDNFAYRIDQALKGNVVALHSAPCYTNGINGYKFCIRVYPNGDGIGRNSHLSIYFVLMKNNYDHLLQWPFYRKISFKVLNIKNPEKTRKETFVTDRLSSSFRKPEKDMNIAAGCPKFLSKDSLLNDGFLVDDSIYVEAIVQEVQ